MKLHNINNKLHNNFNKIGTLKQLDSWSTIDFIIIIEFRQCLPILNCSDMIHGIPAYRLKRYVFAIQVECF